MVLELPRLGVSGRGRGAVGPGKDEEAGRGSDYRAGAGIRCRGPGNVEMEETPWEMEETPWEMARMDCENRDDPACFSLSLESVGRAMCATIMIV